eukprot:4124157-Prymnesium_polylepis.1
MAARRAACTVSFSAHRPTSGSVRDVRALVRGCARVDAGRPRAVRGAARPAGVCTRWGRRARCRQTPWFLDNKKRALFSLS